jgi:hypothetical protein
VGAIKRDFGIDVSLVHCGGAVRIVASIEEPPAIRAILAHFEKHGALRGSALPARSARAASGGLTVPKSRARTRDPRPNRRLRDRRLPDRPPEKSV